MDTDFTNTLIDQFEDEIKAGNSPQIESYVSQWPKESRPEVIFELISLEIFHSIKKGRQVNNPDYTRFGKAATSHAERIKEQFSNLDYETSQSRQFQLSNASVDTRFAIHRSQMIGPYKLLEKLGEGGMGAVWMAEQEKPVKRRVALKLIKSELTSSEVITRFEVERQALAMMDHQNIARVLDAGTTDNGRPYFVMELVDGIPITEYCDKNKLSVEERLMLFLPVCKAVQHAHQKGVLHRDLKPSNVLVSLADGEAFPKVIDFGMAKATEHSTKLTNKTMNTEFGRVVGTLQYMSPEQAELDTVDVDTRADVYSLGVMLYELLSGSTPLDKETLGNNAILQALAIIREKDPPRPSNRLSSSSHEATSKVSEVRRVTPARLQRILKGDLDWLVMKALEKDRKRRYQTANDFAQDISNYLTGEAVKARPPSKLYRVQKFAKRNRGLVASILAIGLVLLAGIFGTSYGLIRANHKTAEAETNRTLANLKAVEADREREKATKNEKMASDESQRARDSEAAAKFQLANARWDANRALEARSLLHQIPLEYRDNFEWHFCNRHFLGSDITCYGHTNLVYKVAFSPDGARVASASRDQTIKLWEAQTGREITTLKGHEHQVGSVAFSLDGTLLASASFDGKIKLWDTESFQEIATLEGHTNLVATVVFSPDSKWLASASDDTTLKLWNVETGKDVTTFKGHTKQVGSVVFSPDGKRLASASVDKTIRLWNVVTGHEISTLRGHDAAVVRVAFCPDGSRLASASQDVVKLWNTQSEQEISTLRHAQFVHDVAFSPDGTRLATAGRDKLIKLWDAHSGQEITTLSGHSGWVNGVAFSPNGARLASASFDKTVKLWDAKSGQQIATLSGHQDTIYSVALSPDGSRIASAGREKTIKLWDLQTGQEISEFKGHTRSVNSVVFSPDGKQLASASSDATIKLWETRSGKEVATFDGHSKAVADIAFSPDGTRIASASDDKTVKLWDVKTGKEISSLEGHNRAVNSVAFSPDGDWLASASNDATIKLWDTKIGQETKTLKGRSRSVRDVAFSPDGVHLASTGGRTIQLWNAKSGLEISALRGHSEVVTSLSFNSSGTRIASASHDKTIKLWNVSSGLEITTLKLEADRVYSVAFSSDGSRLASAGTDNTIRLWDGRMEQETTTLKGHQDTVAGVSFSLNGEQVYSVSDSEEKLVWDVATGKRILDAEWNPPSTQKHVSPDGRWYVTSELNNVVLVDLDHKNTLQGKSYRTSKANFDPEWHELKAKEATDAENWYAATFHYAWLLRNAPDQIGYYVGLHSSHQSLAEKSKKSDDVDASDIRSLLAPVVKESLKLPRGAK